MIIHNGNDDNHSSKEKLTILLTSLFDLIERESPELLYYGDVNLRGAFERYFYFDSILHPERINKLLLACSKKVNSGLNDSSLIIFEEYYHRYGKLGFKKRCKNGFINWARIVNDIVKQLPIFFTRKAKINKNHSKNANRKVGFFIIDQRFASFFETVRESFENDQLIYFSTKSKIQTENSIQLTGQTFGISKKLFIVNSHPFFSVYVRICIHYQLIYDTLEKYRPDVLVFAEGTSHDEYCAAVAARELGIPTIRLQSGRASLLHTGYINMPFDKMLSWGGGFLQHYKSVSPNVQHVVTGNPAIDVLSSEAFKPKGAPKIALLTQPANMGWISENDYEQLELLAKKLINEDIEIVVRMHPADKSDAFFSLSKKTDSIKILNSPEYSLSDVFSQVHCVISFTSTTISEAAACNVIPIILASNQEYRLFPYPEKQGAALVARTVEEAFETSKRILFYPEQFEDMRFQMKQFAQKFFGAQDGKSTQRIYSEINKSIAKKHLKNEH